jgi:hypothetical protein
MIEGLAKDIANVTSTIETVRNSLTLMGGRARFKFAGLLAQARFPHSAEALLSGFLGDEPPSHQAYVDLFSYFMTGFMVRRSPLGAYADYAGMGSYNGPAMDRLEGFSRVAPLAAAWLHGGRSTRIQLGDGSRLDLVAMLRQGILAGTDPSSKEYWGDIKHWGQAIVEAADIALVLWLTRDQLWMRLTTEERSQTSRWLIQVNGKRIPDNNWHLFVVQVNTVLAALGEPHDTLEQQQHYQRAKSFYHEQGWFQDGEQSETPGFDFYNAWGFHYHLQWIRQIDPDLDGAFIDEAFQAFVSTYRYLIGPAGLPMLGRSACYRMATPAPLIFAQDSCPELISPGLARRALDVVWQYFIRHCAVAKGNVTQGYFGPDPRLLEDYSGPASCLWSLRSLVVAFALPDDHALWQVKPEPLPVEHRDYRIAVGPTGWTVTGKQTTGVVTIETGHTDAPDLEKPTLADCILGPFSRKPPRPKNIPAKYYRDRYPSSAPYGILEET